MVSSYRYFPTNLPIIPRSCDDSRVPTSLAYHLADIYLEELDKALGSSAVDGPLPAPLSTLLAPFLALSARTSTALTLQRIQSALLEPLVTTLSTGHGSDGPSRKRLRLSTNEYPNLVANACETEPSKEGAISPSALRKAVFKQVFEVASEPDTRDANRRKLYAFWREHMEEDQDENGNGSTPTSGSRSGKRGLDAS